MSTVLSPSGVELPDGGELHSRAQVNRNFTKINDLYSEVAQVSTLGSPIAGTAKPAANAFKRFSGLLSTSTGAGGTNQAAAGATDASGIGGWWFGALGLPTFSGIYSVTLTPRHSSTTFSYVACLTAVSLTNITYQAYRLSPFGVANYGSIDMVVDVVGW